MQCLSAHCITKDHAFNNNVSVTVGMQNLLQAYSCILNRYSATFCFMPNPKTVTFIHAYLSTCLNRCSAKFCFYAQTQNI